MFLILIIIGSICQIFYLSILIHCLMCVQAITSIKFSEAAHILAGPSPQYADLCVRYNAENYRYVWRYLEINGYI